MNPSTALTRKRSLVQSQYRPPDQRAYPGSGYALSVVLGDLTCRPASLAGLEQLVRDGRSVEQHRAKLVPVDRFRDPRTGVLAQITGLGG